MGKRGAEGGQLIAPSAGGRDDSDDEEPTGPMPVADANVLAQRKIIKPKKKKKIAGAGGSSVFGGGFSLTGGSGAAAKPAPSFLFGAKKEDGDDAAAKPAPSFLFGAKKEDGDDAAAKPAASSPFGSFSFGAKKATSPVAAEAAVDDANDKPKGFAFGANPAALPSAAKANALFSPAAAKPATEVKETAAPAAEGFSFGSTLAKPAAAAAAPAAAAPAKSPGAQSTKGAQFLKLNNEFLDIIQGELKQDTVVDLTPCVNDYLKHAGAIKSGTVPSAVAAVPATAAAATGDGDEEDEEGVEYKTRAKLYYEEYFEDSTKENSLTWQPQITEDKDAGTVTKAWKLRGKGDCTLKRIDGKVALMIRADSPGVDADGKPTGMSGRPFFLNIGLGSHIKPVHTEGKKDIMLMAVPNPPTSSRCAVCNETLQDAKTSNVCKNGCAGPDGCTKDTVTVKVRGVMVEKNVKGMTLKPVPYLIRTGSAAKAKELAAKIEELKDSPTSFL